MSKHVTSLSVYAGMPVNHSSQSEAWSLRQSGLLPILLITHENGESGCCEDWLFCGPCYFNRDLQWNVFYPDWGCCAGQLLSHWTMVVLIIEGLRGQRPKTARADSLRHFTASLSFPFSNSGDVCSQVFPHCSKKEKAKQGLVFYYCEVFESLGHSHKDFKENNPGNVIVLFTLHLGEAFLSLPPSCQGHSYNPWNGFENNPLKKLTSVQ